MRGTVRLTPAEVRALGLLKGQIASHVRSVRDELRTLGLRDLANELGQAAVVLGKMGDMHRAMVVSAERSIPLPAALQVVKAERAAKRRAA